MSLSSVVASQKQEHVKGSKTKYEAGTIVTTETGRRAKVQADGRWKWLASEKKEKKAEPAVKKPVVKPAISSAKEPKPKVRRKVAPSKQEDSDEVDCEAKEPLPLNKPVLKRQNAKLKIHKEIDAFSAQDDSGDSSFAQPAPAQKRRKISKPRQQKSKTSWLSWL